MATEPETAEVEEEEEIPETETEEVEEPETAEEAETEQEPEPEAEGEEPEPQPLPVAAGRKAHLRERAQRAEREAAELRQRVEALERRPAPADPAAAERQAAAEREAEERILLTQDPAQIAKFYSDRSERKSEQKLNQVIHHVVDTSDRTSFQGMCAANPLYASIADEVEKRLAVVRQQGMNPQRIALAHLILGERVAARGKGAKTRQERQAAGEQERQRGRSSTARSDVAGGGRPRQDTHAARAKRLDESGLM
jgi:hypothetical protein